MKSKYRPTQQQFEALQGAYDYFNRSLFRDELPGVMLNLSRKSKAMGFAAKNIWRKSTDEPGKGSVHEISINPEIVSWPAVEVYSTLVHEMCHIWQYCFGKPSRNGYHNTEWANKMEMIGLVPSHTGRPGGKKTGQQMSDYPEPGGKFELALSNMPKKFKLPFVSIEGDQRPAPSPLSVAGEPYGRPEGGHIPAVTIAAKKNKVKYSCPECETNVWGKPELAVICGACGVAFEEIR